MEMEDSEGCKVKERLSNLVQHLLNELAVLAKEEAEVFRLGDKTRINELDKRLENTVGEKERALGALKQHRSEHGC